MQKYAPKTGQKEKYFSTFLASLFFAYNPLIIIFQITVIFISNRRDFPLVVVYVYS